MITDKSSKKEPLVTRIRMAGLNVKITHNYSNTERTTSKFVIPPQKEDPHYDISVEVTEEDIRVEEEKTVAEAKLEKLPTPHYPDSYLETTAVYRKIADKMPAFGGIVFHGSAVAVGNKAYLFAAHSGVGKTTHTRLWLKNIEGSYVVNGDKPILRVMDGVVYACGTPWMGKEKLGVAKNVPLEAIVFLSRGKQNEIAEVPLSVVLPRLIEQTYRSPDPAVLSQTLDVIKQIASRVRFYKLSCNMDPEAALICYKGLTK